MLRPACEELLWLKYINTLTVDDSKSLADCLVKYGLLRDLEAQAHEVDDETMTAMGLPSVPTSVRQFPL